MATKPIIRTPAGVAIDHDRIVREALEQAWRILRRRGPNYARYAVALALADQEGPPTGEELRAALGVPEGKSWYTAMRPHSASRPSDAFHYVKPVEYVNAELRILQDRANRIMQEGLRNGDEIG